MHCTGLYNSLQTAKFLIAFVLKGPSKYLWSVCWGTFCSSPEGECSVEILQKPHKWATGSSGEQVYKLLSYLCRYHPLLPNLHLLGSLVHIYVLQPVRRWCPALPPTSLLSLGMSPPPCEMVPRSQRTWPQEVTRDTVSGTSKCPAQRRGFLIFWPCRWDLNLSN